MRGRIGLLVVAMVLPASAARADPVIPHDSVTLRNGAIYSGEIVEKVPGDHETLKLATGEVKRFEWADIVPAAPPAPPAPPPPPPPVAVPTPAAPPARQVRVRLDADNVNTQLEAYGGVDLVADGNGRVYEQEEGIPVCTAPCDKPLTGGRYRVNGPGIVPSGWFDLPVNADSVVLHAKTSSQVAMTLGVLMTATSVGVGVGGGVPFYVVGNEPQSPNQAFKDVGIGFFVLGTAMLVVGIPLWILNGSSSVRTDSGTLSQAARGGFAF
jgi:hypothetical protein